MLHLEKKKKNELMFSLANHRVYFYTVSISIQEFSFLLLLCESFANSTNDALVFIQGVKGNSAYYTHLLLIGVLFKFYV